MEDSDSDSEVFGFGSSDSGESEGGGFESDDYSSSDGEGAGKGADVVQGAAPIGAATKVSISPHQPSLLPQGQFARGFFWWFLARPCGREGNGGG